jgi:transcriptional regulator with XRE-family HTH domain
MNRKPKKYPEPSVLAERIIACREALDIAQFELAIKAGVSPRTMAALEHGHIRDPQITTLMKIADALQVSLDYLLGRPAFPYRMPRRPKGEGRDSFTELYGQTA